MMRDPTSHPYEAPSSDVGHPPSWGASPFKSIFLRLAALALGGLALNLLNVVGFHYFRRVENDPFRASAEVVKIADDRIELADGRAFRPHGGVDEELRELIRDSRGRIGLEVDEGGIATLYVKSHVFVCGFGMPLITIPLIPIDVPAYRQKAIAVGRIEIGLKADGAAH